MSYLDDVKKEVAEGTAQLVDVREQQEWNEGHVVNATLAPLTQLENDTIPENLDKNKKTYLYCRSGNRVYMAQPIFEEHGFEDVQPLDEGYMQLVDEGFESA